MTDNRADRASAWLEKYAESHVGPYAKERAALTGAAKLLREQAAKIEEQAATIRNLNIALAGEDVTVGID